MGCGSSVAVLPEDAITYDNNIAVRDSKIVKSSDSYDSGVGYEMGSKESSTVSETTALPDIGRLNGPTFADRKPLPPHPFEASFTERFPVIGPPREFNNEIENQVRPIDSASDSEDSEYGLEFICEESEERQIMFIERLPRPPTPEFLVSGQPLRPLRGKPPRQASTKRCDIIGARNQSVNQAQKQQNLGDHLLGQLKDFDGDQAVTKRPPSRGGLAFDVVFGEEADLSERVDRLKKRQKHKAPKLQKRISKAQVKKKILEAELRRQQIQLEQLTKLSNTHSTVDEAGQKVNKMEEMKRAEMKRAQDQAMEKAVLARKKHLEEMRDRIRAKNEKVRRANEAKLAKRSRPPTADKYADKLPSLLGF